MALALEAGMDHQPRDVAAVLLPVEVVHDEADRLVASVDGQRVRDLVCLGFGQGVHVRRDEVLLRLSNAKLYALPEVAHRDLSQRDGHEVLLEE
jgi:hypothetical protein